MNNELYHHGILGQKWGVRRFQNKDGSLTNAGEKRYSSNVANKYAAKSDKYRSKIDTARTSFGRNRAITKAHEYEYRAKRADAASKEKTLIGKVSQYIGNKAKANALRANAGMQKELSEKSTSAFRSKLADTRAYNASQLAKTYDKRSKEKFSSRIGREFLYSMINTTSESADISRTSIKTLTGRKTTVGREKVLTILTGNAGNLAFDAVYAYKNRNELSSDMVARKERAAANKEAYKAAREARRQNG